LYFIKYIGLLKAFANPEDLTLARHQSTVVSTDSDVERIRRNHLNDIENIIPLILIVMLLFGIFESFLSHV
jgi:hypothetical protein